MKEANDESSSAIGCEVWMNLGPSMSCEHLTDRHKPARGNGGSKSGRTVGAGLQSGKPLNAPEIPGDIL